LKGRLSGGEIPLAKLISGGSDMQVQRIATRRSMGFISQQVLDLAGKCVISRQLLD
jgi:hypothetical protein